VARLHHMFIPRRRDVAKPSPAHAAPTRPWFFPLVVVGLVTASSLSMAASVQGSLGAFTAGVTNNGNTTGTGTIVLQEQNAAGTVTCNSTDAGLTANDINTNSSLCSTIDQYGGTASPLVPGGSVATTITFRNTGTAAASVFTVTPGACTQSAAGGTSGSATDLCAKLTVAITKTVGGTTSAVGSGTATALASGGVLSIGSLAAGASLSITTTVTLSSSAGNTYQGLNALQPMVWQFTT
jgi:hypothetical protein